MPISTETYTDSVDKEETVWNNITESDVQYDSAGNEMDKSEQARFLRQTESQDQVREITYTPPTEPPSKQQFGEITRDTVSTTFDGQSVGFSYSIEELERDDRHELAAGTSPDIPDYSPEMPDYGVEEPDVGVDRRTTAKITLYGEEKDIHAQGIDPEELNECFQRQFREAQRDPLIEPRQEMSEEHKQEKGYSQQYTHL